MRQLSPRSIILFVTLVVYWSLAGRAEAGSLGETLRHLLEQASREKGTTHDRDTQAAATTTAKAKGESRLLDSLLRLASQDVGINPDEGSVQKAIWRVRVIKFNLQAARRSLDNTRQEIFSLAATAEELKALKELDERIAAAPDSASGDLMLERRRLQDAAIDQAKRDGRLQKQKLGADQAKRVGLLLYNLGVGVVCDNLAIRHSQSVLDDFKRVKDELSGGQGWKGAVAWASLAAYHQEFLAVPGEMGRILLEAPAQLGALGAMIGTVRVLKENNAIEEREAKPGDRFETIEDF